MLKISQNIFEITFHKKTKQLHVYIFANISRGLQWGSDVANFKQANHINIMLEYCTNAVTKPEYS